MYVCMYVCMYVYIYIYIYAHLLYTYTYMCLPPEAGEGGQCGRALRDLLPVGDHLQG